MTTLVNLVDPETLTGEARDAAESGIAQYGQALNTWRAIMNKPELFAAYLPFIRAVAGPGDLDPVLKDLSALYVATLNNCRYTASHRSTSAKAKGVSDEQLRAIVSEQWDALSERDRLAFELTREMTLLPAAFSYSERPQIANEELLARLKQEFTDVELVELTMSIAFWNALTRFHRVMGFEFDMPIAPEGVNPK